MKKISTLKEKTSFQLKVISTLETKIIFPKVKEMKAIVQNV